MRDLARVAEAAKRHAREAENIAVAHEESLARTSSALAEAQRLIEDERDTTADISQERDKKAAALQAAVVRSERAMQKGVEADRRATATQTRLDELRLQIDELHAERTKTSHTVELLQERASNEDVRIDSVRREERQRAELAVQDADASHAEMQRSLERALAERTEASDALGRERRKIAAEHEALEKERIAMFDAVASEVAEARRSAERLGREAVEGCTPSTFEAPRPCVSWGALMSGHAVAVGVSVDVDCVGEWCAAATTAATSEMSDPLHGVGGDGGDVCGASASAATDGNDAMVGSIVADLKARMQLKIDARSPTNGT